jgi:hypothetical protein
MGLGIAGRGGDFGAESIDGIVGPPGRQQGGSGIVACRYRCGGEQSQEQDNNAQFHR